MIIEKLKEKILTYSSILKKPYFMQSFFCLTVFSSSICAFAANECSKTSTAALRACRNEARDDYNIAVGNCLNLPSFDEQEACKDEVLETFKEFMDECKAQFDAREEVCEDLGQDPYHPDVNPDDFPFTDGIIPNPNPFFPLIPGTTFVYEGGGETITVTVTDELKEIIGVNCIAVRDVVEEDGEAVEDTIDWYAQDVDGNVWYFGEISKNFEDGELNNLDGSWISGVEGAKPGIIMKANPEVGNVYRQEFFLGDAEDMARIVDLNGSETVPAADCSGDCLVTEEFTPVEPGFLENKYYASGIGFILEVNPETGERLELIEIISP